MKSKHCIDERAITAPMLTFTKSKIEIGKERALMKRSITESQEYDSVSLSNLGDQLQSEDGFSLAVSLHDASALHVSSSITKVLGYPRDMLVGQCILDYLYPRDRLTFASYLSQSLQTRFSSLNSSSNSTSTTDDKFIFYVRIRQHKSLTGGCAVVEDRPTYRPFQLKCYIKNVLVREECDSGSEDATICLIVSATPIRSAHHRKYGQNVLELTVQSVSQECTPSMAPFSTRHTTSGHFSHMDSNGIAYLGYLPQDILGFSIFDFYHREDLTLLRDIYQLVAREQGASFRSKPYRFKVFNGDFVTLDTEWSCFINPWSRKIEFIVGQHRILSGPIKPNVFEEGAAAAEEEDENCISDECEKLQNEIIYILSQAVKTASADVTESGARRKRRLPAVAGNVIDGVPSPKECSCSDLGSVVMGEISPHREDFEPSEETPPSFQATRLADNIERFFASQPKTNCRSSSGGSSSNITNAQNHVESGSNDGSGSCSNPKDGGGSSQADSAFQSGSCGEGTATGSNDQPSPPAPTKTVPSQYGFSLTEDILTYHNRSSQRQRQARSTADKPPNCDTDGTRRAHLTAENVTKSAAEKQREDSCHRTGQGQHLNHDRTSQTSAFPTNYPFNMGIPFVLSPGVCQSCSNPANGSQTSPMLMPVMCFGALPLPVYCNQPYPVAFWNPICPNNSNCLQAGSHGRPAKRNVRLQTDWESFDMMKAERDRNIGTIEKPIKESRKKQKLLSANCSSESFDFSSSSELKSDETSGFDLRSSDSGSGANDCKSIGTVLRGPHWMDGIDFSDEVALRYQTAAPELSFALGHDLVQSAKAKQPSLVRKQLELLNNELEGMPSCSGHSKPCLGYNVLEEDITQEMEKREEIMMILIGGDDNM